MSRNKGIWIERDYELCSGCRRCEIACSLFHEGKIWPEASRIRIFMLVPGVEIPHLCFQCEDYPCVKACSVRALSVNSQIGAVKVDVSKCTGCGLCVEACQEGKWNALKLTSRRSGFSYKALAKTPEELTIEIAKKLFGEEIAKEVWE